MSRSYADAGLASFRAGCASCRGQFCGPVQPGPSARVGAMANYVQGPNDLWDNLFMNVQGGKLDPVNLYGIQEQPPPGADPNRWAGFLDGVTYGGTRTGLLVGVVSLAVGFGLGMLMGSKRGTKHHRHHKSGSPITEIIDVR